MIDVRNERHSLSTPLKDLRILHVEDSETDAIIIQRAIKKSMPKCEITHINNMKDVEGKLREDDQFDIILLDLGLPDTSDRKESFKRVEKLRKNIPVIILTSVNDHDLALGFVGKGAENYIKKSVVCETPETLQQAIEFAVCHYRHQKTQLAQKDQMLHWVTGGYSIGP